MTSHKAQGRTCEHVVIAAEKLDTKAAYVACSRGRQSCVIHTPDKQRLLERLPPGSRTAALDVLAESRKSSAIVHRAPAWARLFGQTVTQSVKNTRRRLQRFMEQTRRAAIRWSRHQTNCFAHHPAHKARMKESHPIKTTNHLTL